MKRSRFLPAILSSLGVLFASAAFADEPQKPAIVPTEKIELFNGKNLDGWYTWLMDEKHEDPRQVFTVGDDGLLRISGDGFGGIITNDEYKDYHIVIEYRWGTKTWAPREHATKDGGLLVHCVGPDGNFGGNPGPWMTSIEFQIIEGGVGDILVLRGKDSDGSEMKALASVESIKDRDGEPIYKPGAPLVEYTTGRINWWGRDEDWKDVLGFRGPHDLDHPGQEWTRIECFAKGDTLTYLVNGVIANKASRVFPSQGKILIQTEGAEMFVRKIELNPLPETIPE